MYGWVVPTMPTRELYVQGTQGRPRVSNPRTGRLKTTALAIGPSMSHTINPLCHLVGGVPGVGLCCGGGGGWGFQGRP